MSLYPLLLNPALHVKVWGGRQLETLLHKALPTAEHIVFVESRFPAVTVFTKNGNRWDKAFFNEKQEEVEIRGHFISLEKIYRKTAYFAK